MWTSTTDGRRAGAPIRLLRAERGFSLLELLIGLALALCLALAVAPLWTSSESVASGEADAAVWVLQARVAGARFEKDVRTAGFPDCAFQTASMVLQATPSQVVLLVQAPGEPAPHLVEWELTGGALMRRWGPCPEYLPASFAHSFYPDSKTMLEGVDTARSAFTYTVVAQSTDINVPTSDLPYVDAIALDLAGGAGTSAAGIGWAASAKVGL